MQLIDALNRIERAGQENSASTLKLKEAVAFVAFEIVKRAAPSGLDFILGSHGFWIEVRDGGGGNIELRSNDRWNGYRVPGFILPSKRSVVGERCVAATRKPAHQVAILNPCKAGRKR